MDLLGKTRQRNHSKSTYTQRGARVMPKANIHCLDDIILLFKSEQGGEEVQKSPILSVCTF